jgi:hypothetical protein
VLHDEINFLERFQFHWWLSNVQAVYNPTYFPGTLLCQQISRMKPYTFDLLKQKQNWHRDYIVIYASHSVRSMNGTLY